MKITTFVVDAFTDRPFTGNPAGVCLLTSDLDEASMQSIAAELNLSETAFLHHQQDDTYLIRFFTPTVEIEFCGHATLASARVVLEKTDRTEVKFVTPQQLKLLATQEGAYIKMDFPLYDTVNYVPPAALLEAMGIKKVEAARFCDKLDMLVIEVATKAELLALMPDYSRATESTEAIKELVVTTRSEDAAYDFYSRCFCPWIGIPEDPVTGASHAVLAKYWAERLDKSEMSAFQLSARGGYLHLRIVGEHHLEVRSQAQVVLSGELIL